MTTPAEWCTPEASEDPRAAARRNPDHRGVTYDALCDVGWTSLMITGLIRDLVTRNFASPGNIQAQSLRKLVWRPGERTDILVESNYKLTPALAEKRPAVIIKDNGRKNLIVFIDDRAYEDEQGNQVYTTYWVGSHTLFCIQESGASAVILATEVERYLHGVRDEITSRLGLQRWAVTEVGGPQKVKESRDNYAVPVTVGWCYGTTWKLEEEAIKLRSLSIQMLLDGAFVQQTP